MALKKYYGGYEICEALGYEPGEYTKITYFLNFINAPMTINKKGTQTYVLTEKQVKYLKDTLTTIKLKLEKLE